MSRLAFLLIVAAAISKATGRDWNEEVDLYWARNCDWQGNDMGEAIVPPERCGPTCAARPGCTHFTWTPFNTGTCWLKTNAVSRGQEKQHRADENSICGIMKSSSPGPPAPGSQNGKTTRYWDCCKVSCGWNYKAPFSAPVTSCQKDGVTAIDVNEQSGCNGGPSYTCNNNQPWSVNDNLAYGFAAAHLSGQSERDWCCACYELSFTSGPVVGKKMIVQVTNTGGDLGENHFDLQMPGGGVGLFNGCTPQWGAPPDGWGQRYGGVSNRGQCDQLPPQLRQGCYWRFDWFKNADNPTISFRPIACPAELTQKTNCRRN